MYSFVFVCKYVILSMSITQVPPPPPQIKLLHRWDEPTRRWWCEGAASDCCPKVATNPSEGRTATPDLETGTPSGDKTANIEHSAQLLWNPSHNNQWQQHIWTLCGLDIIKYHSSTSRVISAAVIFRPNYMLPGRIWIDSQMKPKEKKL